MLEKMKGTDLKGLKYEMLFDFLKERKGALFPGRFPCSRPFVLHRPLFGRTHAAVC